MSSLKTNFVFFSRVLLLDVLHPESSQNENNVNEMDRSPLRRRSIGRAFHCCAPSRAPLYSPPARIASSCTRCLRPSRRICFRKEILLEGWGLLPGVAEMTTCVEHPGHGSVFCRR
ncbi:hypothetical protein CEXT_751461 [Caerostris extrusa]|uniref:Uncharacterized protein n=1 Tax=Caerostris extrusa TaxID=172846 RepID=A0AAV4N9B6_CAEEX|nr:hypothetical protein CEXT_751461 [Caerostris extrusa]